MNFVSAIACHFCLSLPAEFTQPRDHLLAQPFTWDWDKTNKTDSLHHLTLFCDVGESPALRSDHGLQKVEVGKEVDVIPYLGIDVTVGVISSEAALDHRPFGKEFQVG